MTMIPPSEPSSQYVDEAAPWPTSPGEATAEALIRHAAGYGLRLSAGSWRLVKAPEPLHHYAAIVEMQLHHDQCFLLDQLRKLDPMAADDAAQRIWITADAGDLAGEALYKWADQAGLDAERICAERIAWLEPKYAEWTAADLPAGSAVPETMHVAVGFDGDSESVYVYPAEPGEADGSPSLHEADIPAALMARLDAASAEWEAVLKEIAASAGVDPDTGDLVQVCPEWKGDEHPGHTWWSFTLPASGAGDVWPVIPISPVGPHFTTQTEAEAWRRDLPPDFKLLAAGGRQVVDVDRNSLALDRHEIPPYASACHDCGHERSEHAGNGSQAVGS